MVIKLEHTNQKFILVFTGEYNRSIVRNEVYESFGMVERTASINCRVVKSNMIRWYERMKNAPGEVSNGGLSLAT